MLKIVLSISFFVVGFLVLAGTPTIFYYVNDQDGTLWLLNVSTGVSTQIGAMDVSDVEAIAYWPEPGNNILYAAERGF